jgi:hypothetical protein
LKIQVIKMWFDSKMDPLTRPTPSTTKAKSCLHV